MFFDYTIGLIKTSFARFSQIHHSLRVLFHLQFRHSPVVVCLSQLRVEFEGTGIVFDSFLEVASGCIRIASVLV